MKICFFPIHWGKVLSALAVCTFVSAQSQPKTSLRDTLREATVTALRTPDALRSAAPHWSADTTSLRRQGVTDMGQALRRFAGVHLRDYGGAGGLKTVSVRGLGAAHTTVCYDGLAVSDARQGQTDLSRFNLDRLSGLSLSVADAPELLCPVRSLGAATLHLYSPAPDTSTLWKGSAGLRTGSFGMANPSLFLTRRTGVHAALSGSADFYYARNDYPYTLHNGNATTREHRTNSRMQAWNGELNWTCHTPDGSRWAAKAYYRNHHQRLPGQVVLYSKKGTERLAEQNAFAQLSWKKKSDRWQWMAAGKWGWQESRYADIDAQQPNGALRQNYWQREGYATAGLARHWPFWKLAYAADYLYNSLNSNLKTQNRAYRHTLLQCVSLQYARQSLYATARLSAHTDWNRCTDGEAARDVRKLSPSLSLSWNAVNRNRASHPYSLFIRAFYKDIMRVPTFTESYYYHLGAQVLRPEHTRQIGAGITLQARPARWFTSVHLTADAYFNRITDRITSIPYNLFVWQTVNLGKVRAGGLDVTAKAVFLPARQHELFFSANYSLQKAADRTDPAARSYGKQPAYLPCHSGAASLAYENPWCNLSFSLSGVSERWSTNDHASTTRLPGYIEAGCGIYRRFSLDGSQLLVRADVTNLFDKQYEVIRRYPMPGRSFRLSLDWSF